MLKKQGKIFRHSFYNYLSIEIQFMNLRIAYKLLLLYIPFLLISCGNKKNEDITETVNKNGSIETSVQVTHLDSTRDVLTTTHKVWVKLSEYKTVQYHDTIPSLGLETTVAENAEGDTKNISVPKEYELFITVK
ncbi:MAG: hypothetical protein JWQ96_2531 [Segetibacter sp.]|nr:hypothetical protein [Segetibacter sp.]